MNANRANFQHLAPNRGERNLERRLRRHDHPLRQRLRGIRPRQRLAVDLAVLGAGQRVEAQDMRRDHVIRQYLAQFGSQPAHALNGAIGRRDIANKVIAVQNGGGFRATGNTPQRIFDITKLDAETAQFDLVIGASEQFETAVCEIAGAIAGAIEAPIRRRRQTDYP